MVWEDTLKLPHTSQKLISKIYNNVLSRSRDYTPKLKRKWESELGVELTDEWWSSALHRINHSSSCARLSLIQLKLVHRTYFCNARLAEIYQNVSPMCPRCFTGLATLFHMFWSCPKISGFWSAIFNTISDWVHFRIEGCPLLAMFGVPRAPLPCNAHLSDMIVFLLLLARRRILIERKSSTPPRHSVWLSDTMSFIQLEKIKFTLKGSTDLFFKRWQPFLTYFENLPVIQKD